MSIYENLINQQKARGKLNALDLRNRAPEMTDISIVKEKINIPVFEPTKDYSSWVTGAPVKEMIDGVYKVFRLVTPHNANDYSGTPSTLTNLWTICEETEDVNEDEETTEK